MQQVLWLPISDVGLTPPAWVPRLSTVQCPFWVGSVWLTHLPNQGFIQGSKGGAIYPDPFPSGRPGDLMKKVPPTNPPYPSFILPPHQQNRYFSLSCGLICLGMTQLITLSTFTQTDCSQGDVYKNSLKMTKSKNTSNSWINSFNYTVYRNFLVSTTVTISSKVCAPTICSDSQRWGISQGSMYTPLF